MRNRYRRYRPVSVPPHTDSTGIPVSLPKGDTGTRETDQYEVIWSGSLHRAGLAPDLSSYHTPTSWRAIDEDSDSQCLDSQCLQNRTHDGLNESLHSDSHVTPTDEILKNFAALDSDDRRDEQTAGGQDVSGSTGDA